MTDHFGNSLGEHGCTITVAIVFQRRYQRLGAASILPCAAQVARFMLQAQIIQVLLTIRAQAFPI
jgi:hypothetical protein